MDTLDMRVPLGFTAHWNLVVVADERKGWLPSQALLVARDCVRFADGAEPAGAGLVQRSHRPVHAARRHTLGTKP